MLSGVVGEDGVDVGMLVAEGGGDDGEGAVHVGVGAGLEFKGHG